MLPGIAISRADLSFQGMEEEEKMYVYEDRHGIDDSPPGIRSLTPRELGEMSRWVNPDQWLRWWEWWCTEGSDAYKEVIDLSEVLWYCNQPEY
jgi:hypothetical protein